MTISFELNSDLLYFCKVIAIIESILIEVEGDVQVHEGEEMLVFSGLFLFCYSLFLADFAFFVALSLFIDFFCLLVGH